MTPTGDIVQFGGKRIKDVTGYDLVKLMVGSEGTLGIFTKVFIKLLPRPSVRIAILTFFENPAAAIAVLPAVMTAGRFIPSAIEFIDGFCFSETARYLKEIFPFENIGAVLLFEVDGTHLATVKKNAETICRLCRQNGAIAVHVGKTPEEMDRFWRIRKAIPWQLRRHSPHQSVEDIVVPTAAIPQIRQEIIAIGEKYDVRIPVFGHAGDGNLHVDEIYNIFLNSRLLATRSKMGYWMRYQQIQDNPLEWKMEVAVKAGDRIGLFGRDMAALVI